jgi:predicted GNAT family acetyltransferase
MTSDNRTRDEDVAGAPAGEFVDNPARSRFEITVDGLTATLDYERTLTTLTLIHTEVPEALRGRGFGARLVESAVRAGRAERLQLVVVCPFARAYLRAHPVP